eukprot:1760109-Lingulodinium_polyedra.AAC.1
MQLMIAISPPGAATARWMCFARSMDKSGASDAAAFFPQRRFTPGASEPCDAGASSGRDGSSTS